MDRAPQRVLPRDAHRRHHRPLLLRLRHAHPRGRGQALPPPDPPHWNHPHARRQLPPQCRPRSRLPHGIRGPPLLHLPPHPPRSRHRPEARWPLLISNVRFSSFLPSVAGLSCLSSSIVVFAGGTPCPNPRRIVLLPPSSPSPFLDPQPPSPRTRNPAPPGPRKTPSASSKKCRRSSAASPTTASSTGSPSASRARPSSLKGYASRPTLKDEAGRVVKGIPGIDSVHNEIEVLPLSPNDDRIRAAVYNRIYTQPVLSKYNANAGTLARAMGPGGRSAAFMAGGITNNPPIGYHAVHIIVKGGHVSLYGVVLNSGDAAIAGMQANSAPGAFSVDNNLVVQGSTTRTGPK